MGGDVQAVPISALKVGVNFRVISALKVGVKVRFISSIKIGNNSHSQGPSLFSRWGCKVNAHPLT